MTLDLKLLCDRVSRAEDEPPVPTGNVSTYLLENVLWRVVNGEKVCYGDIDYDKFDDQDLRLFAGYCDDFNEVSAKLEKYRSIVAHAVPEHVRVRAFC